MDCRLLVALVVVSACGRDAAKPPPPPPPEAVADPRVDGWRADLAHLGRELPARHHAPFFHLPEAGFRAELAAIDAAVPTLTDEQVQVRMAQLVATLGDGHTRLAVPARALYPLRLFWFDDGLFLLAAPKQDWWAVGGEIVAIGGTPTPDALALLGTVAPHDNGSQLRSEAASALLQPLFVTGLGLANPDGTLTLSIRTGDEPPRPLVLTATPTPPSWPPNPDPPLARRAPGRTYWSHYLPESRALFIQYNKCVEAQPSFADFTASVAEVLARQQVERVVIDLRNNGGGNSRIIAPLVALLAAHPTLRVFVLIGRATFSSGVLNALELEAAGATLVGEIAGGAPSHHGEVQTFTLPGHGLVVTYSTKFHANARHPGPELRPAIAVAPLARDWFAGKDAALDAALAAP